jgi:hypothetical protein
MKVSGIIRLDPVGVGGKSQSGQIEQKPTGFVKSTRHDKSNDWAGPP